VELIESPVAADRAGHVGLLAVLAAEAAQVDPGAVDAGWHQAWDAVFPRALRLLDDPDAAIRRSIVWAAGASRFQSSTSAASLKARFEREPDTDVRGDIIDALARLGEDDWVGALSGHADPSVSVPALLQTKTREASTVDPDQLARVLAAVTETSDWDLYAPVHGGSTPALTASDKAAVAEALADHPEPRRRTAAVRLANILLAGNLDLDDRLVPLLAARVDDPETRSQALEVLAAVAAPFPELYASRLDDRTPGRRSETVADAALWALVRVGDVRCVPVLREQIAVGERHSRLHDATTHIWYLPSLGEMLEQVPEAFVPELLPAVRNKISAGPHKARLDYLHALVAWGPRASAARPEVEALLGSEADFLARQALDAVVPTTPEPPDPAELAARDDWTRTRAAHRLWRATGDTAEAARVLIAVVEEVLDGPQALPVGRAAITYLAEMGAAEAEPAARRILAENRRLCYFGGWRVFTEDESWRRAARAIV